MVFQPKSRRRRNVKVVAEQRLTLWALPLPIELGSPTQLDDEMAILNLAAFEQANRDHGKIQDPSDETRSVQKMTVN